MTAGRLAGENKNLRPTTKRQAAEIGGLRAELADCEGKLAALTKQVATYAKMLFGRSSEKKAGQKEEQPAAADPPPDEEQDL